MDVKRNLVIMADTTMAAAATAIGFGVYITGIFGMNLDQVLYLQPQKGSFVKVTMISLAVTAAIYLAVHYHLVRRGIVPSR
jgi:Mg2+ and Co2+ transporter CorA